MKIKNRKKLISILALAIIILIILIIPKIVQAIKPSFDPSNFDSSSIGEEAIEEANQRERQRLLKEKEEFAQALKNGEYPETYSSTIDETEEKDEQIIAGMLRAEEKAENVNNIIRKYYAEEYDAVVEKLDKEHSENEVVNILGSQLSENDKVYYDIVLKVLENNNLSKKDSEAMKEYIRSQLFNIKKDSNLNDRANKILE